MAIKSGFSDAEAQDIVQDTIVSVAKKMRHFHYDPKIGSFKAWLLQYSVTNYGALAEKAPADS